MKIINFCKKLLMSAMVVIMCLIVYGYYSVPNVINTIEKDKIKFSGIYTVSINNKTEYDAGKSLKINEDYEASVRLFNKIPVKKASTIIEKRKYLVPSGKIIGLRMFSKGVMIISTDSVDTDDGTISPSENSGIRSGDLIVKVNGKEINTVDQLTKVISESNGKEIELSYIRDNKEFRTSFTPILSKDGKYRAGWWIRDSAAGIGTMTFYDKDTGFYGGLGHGICDTDTELLLPLYFGDIVEAEISGCYKGTKGKAGELCGVLSSKKIGEINMNCNKGVYGILNKIEDEDEMPVALKSEVKEGEASILSSIDNKGVKEYSIEIEKIDMKDGSSRNLVIKITDKELLSVTGGIIQGMSGSPIIQDGKLVGAVTHVLVNDPSRGYGIFIQNMLDAVK